MRNWALTGPHGVKNLQSFEQNGPSRPFLLWKCNVFVKPRRFVRPKTLVRMHPWSCCDACALPLTHRHKHMHSCAPTSCSFLFPAPLFLTPHVSADADMPGLGPRPEPPQHLQTQHTWPPLFLKPSNKAHLWTTSVRGPPFSPVALFSQCRCSRLLLIGPQLQRHHFHQQRLSQPRRRLHHSGPLAFIQDNPTNMT